MLIKCSQQVEDKVKAQNEVEISRSDKITRTVGEIQRKPAVQLCFEAKKFIIKD